MKTIVVTGSTPSMATVNARTVAGKKAWAERHNYEFVELQFRQADAPMISRAQHIGQEDGVHTGETINEFWAVDAPYGTFEDVA